MVIIKKLSIVIFILCLLIFIYIIIKSNSNLNISFSKIGSSYSEKVLAGNWWFNVTDKSDKRLKEYGIILPNDDFNSHNIIITNGREIKSLLFEESKSFPYKKTHFVNVILKKELHQHTWFLYEIDKIAVYKDERSGEILIEE